MADIGKHDGVTPETHVEALEVPAPLRAAMGRVAALDTSGLLAARDKVAQLEVATAKARAELADASDELHVYEQARAAACRTAAHHLVSQQPREGTSLEERAPWWAAAVELSELDPAQFDHARAKAQLDEALRLAGYPADTPVLVRHARPLGRAGESRFSGYQTAAEPRIGITRAAHVVGITVPCADGRMLEHPLSEIVTKNEGENSWRPGHNWVFGDEIPAVTQAALIEAYNEYLNRVPGSIAGLASALRAAGLSLSEVGMSEWVQPYVQVAFSAATDPAREARHAETDWEFILNYRPLDQATINALETNLAERLATYLQTHTGRTARNNAQQVLQAKVERIIRAQRQYQNTDVEQELEKAVAVTTDHLMARARNLAKTRRA